jgi:hypothetical protein
MLKDDGWEQVSGPRVTRPTERQGGDELWMFDFAQRSPARKERRAVGFLLGEDTW